MRKDVAYLIIGSIIFSALTAGCFEGTVAQQSAGPIAERESALRTPPMQEYPPPAPKTEGSLFSDLNSNNYYFTDVKAAKVGDIVTINIIETAKASKQAKTDLLRDSKNDVGMDALLGYETNFGFPADFKPSTAIKQSLKTDFKGSGKTTRDESMTAQMSARVIQVLPNGNLVIRGSREISVNYEKQFITLQGVVRPQDVSAENTVNSNLIADARIDYTGKGDVSQQQRKGWGTRLLDFVWPF